MGLDRFQNGGTNAPQIGDMIVSAPGGTCSSCPVGHIAIIRSVSSSQVRVAQQNVTQATSDVDYPLTLSISNGIYTVGNFTAGLPVAGWLRRQGAAPPVCTAGNSANYTINGYSPLHPHGSLIKLASDTTFYLIRGGQKQGITSEAVLEYLYENGGFRFDDVVNVSQAEYDSYSTVNQAISSTLPSNGRSKPDGTLIRKASGEISIVSSNGYRRGFASYPLFLGLGYKDCNLVSVSDSEYTSYPALNVVDAMPKLTASLRLFNIGTVGQQMRGEFTVTNVGTSAVTFTRLGIGGRLNDSTIADFPFRTNITLAPGEPYSYVDFFTPATSGTYRFYVAYQEANSVWTTSVPKHNNAINTETITITGTAPAAPTAIAATNITTNSFTANWNSSGGATGYRLDVSTSNTFATYVSGYQNFDVGNVTSRSVTGLTANTTYYYRVRAYNSSGTSGNSNTISATTTQIQNSSIQFSSATYNINENGGSATITVTRTGGTAAVGVSYATSNGTATAGSDYTAASGTLNFVVGDNSETFTVPITNDTIVEVSETINLTLSNPTGGAVLGSPNPAVLTIIDNDSCTFSIAPPSRDFIASGGNNNNFSVTAPIGCNWTPASPMPWITITSGSGSGNGQVTYNVAQNTGPARTAPINISNAGNTVAIHTVNQAQPTTINRTRFDFDGDRKTDIGIFRPSNGEWWIRSSLNGTTGVLQFGASTDKITPVDFTGDGKTDIAFFRPSDRTWFILRSENSTYFASPFGLNGDVPVPADYDGDGIADIAVFRPSDSVWYIRRSSDGVTTFQQFGTTGDKPVPADYDADGRSDIAIYRPSVGQWWISRTTLGGIVLQFGNASDRPVPADYTGDGKADVAFFRPSTSFWYILRSENFSFFAFPYGLTGDIPVPGDYDGDGTTDPAVFRPTGGLWFALRSTAGTSIQQFGLSTDQPIPSAFLP